MGEGPTAEQMQEWSDEHVGRLTARLLAAEDEREGGVEATRERVKDALLVGGYALVTVKSRVSKKHLTLKFAAKRKEGKRFVSRQYDSGRVGLAEADALFVDGGDNASDEWVATFLPSTGEWRVPREQTEYGRNAAWAAQAVFAWAHGQRDDLTEQAEVRIALRCSRCGHKLTDPQSIDRGVGPECFGKATSSRHA